MIQVEILKQVPFLSGLDKSVLQQITQACKVCGYRANELCFVEGEKAENFYLLLSGRVCLERRLPLHWVHEVVPIHIVSETEVFGWSALAGPGPFTASARCTTDCDVIVIKGKDLLQILEGNSSAGHLVMKRLAAIVASRLAETSERLLREMADFECWRVM
jgi:CRP-like cAMP-binding protein